MLPSLWLMPFNFPTPLPSNSRSSSVKIKTRSWPARPLMIFPLLASPAQSASCHVCATLPPTHQPFQTSGPSCCLCCFLFPECPSPLNSPGDICTRPSRFSATVTSSLIYMSLILPLPSSQPLVNISHSLSTLRCNIRYVLCMCFLYQTGSVLWPGTGGASPLPSIMLGTCTARIQ